MSNLEFRKIVALGRASAEVSGWQAVRQHLSTPELIDWHRGDSADCVIFEDVFASERCQYLLGDCITMADHSLISPDRATELITGVVHDLARCVELTAANAPLHQCVPALYTHRCRPGGRLETWYTPATRVRLGPTEMALRDLRHVNLEINGQPHRLDWAEMTTRVRAQLSPSTCWLTAVTQGDPTEPNIAYPLLWLDFEHAGRNTIAGEIANLLWYLLAMGGWLVPRYEPEVYARTLRRPLPPLVTPQLTELAIYGTHNTVKVSYDWQLGPARAEAIGALLAAVQDHLDPVLGESSTNLLDLLRPFLIMRILTVLPLAAMHADDALLCLAKLAQLQDPNLTLNRFLDDTGVLEWIAP